MKRINKTLGAILIGAILSGGIAMFGAFGAKEQT